jgi:predicted DNA-binding protein
MNLKQSSKSKATVKMSLHLSPETNDTLEQLSEDNHMTKSELLRKALALIEVALKSKEKGNHLVIVDKNDKKISEIIGL